MSKTKRVLRDRAFEGETHIVTGAGQGIGNAVAHCLAAHGACVALVDLDAGKLREAADAIAAQGAVEPIVAAANVKPVAPWAQAAISEVQSLLSRHLSVRSFDDWTVAQEWLRTAANEPNAGE